LDKIFEDTICPDCHGTRVNETVRAALINGKSIADCAEMPVDELIDFLNTIKSSQEITLVLNNLLTRLKSLKTVGLNYLTLSRSTSTLSGGESQRIKMTKHLNSALSDVLYIFDEPSVGLHPYDLIGINKIFMKLRDKGNTVILIDHDPDVIRIADHVIEMGKYAGKNGGKVTFEGSYAQLLQSSTLTGQALIEKHRLRQADHKFSDYYELTNVSKFNVKNASIKIPKAGLTVVTGVAGSGKSTLIRQLLVEKYHQATVFDQSGLKGSSRSNLLTYLGVFDEIRKIFAKASNESASLFSFNGQGACPECKGKG